MSNHIRIHDYVDEYKSQGIDILLWVGDGAFSLSLYGVSMASGKVAPFSQISTSFLIFSYKIQKQR